MRHNFVPLFALFFLSFSVRAQLKPAAIFAEPTADEKALDSYTKDPDTAGIVLYEKGAYFVEEIGNAIRLVKEVHVRMKVFDAKNFQETEVYIPFYTEKNLAEKVTNIKAVTLNGIVENYVDASAIYTTDETENWKVKRFAFPAVEDGSILEYTYRIESPYFSNLEGWEFQGNLPKLYSELETKIPGNFVYKRELLGNVPLNVNESYIEKSCLYLKNFPDAADCDVGVYAMRDIPAIQEENYMLASNNYVARIKYELQETTDFDGRKTSYTKTWEDVDNEFKKDRDFGRQLKNNSFFEDKLPSKIKSMQDPLAKAKAIFYYIQDHYTWNGNYRIFSDIRVRDAFKEAKGNNTEINLSLINALQAADLDAKVMLISTRNNGLPSSSYPVMTDFNFAIVALFINTSVYLLDATDKEAAFNVLPFRDLNTKGRVMDFENGSYWLEIKPNPNNIYYVSTQLTANSDGVFKGKTNELYTGHIAAFNRKKLAQETELGLAKGKEGDALDIRNFSTENVSDAEQPLKVSYDVSVASEKVGDKIYLAPYFFDTYIDENPFTANQRAFPIDFGFPITNTYLVSIDLKDQYSVETLPKNQSFKLPKDIAECAVAYQENAGKINVRFTMKVNASRLNPEAYEYIKTFFDKVITIQNEHLIVLQKM